MLATFNTDDEILRAGFFPVSELAIKRGDPVTLDVIVTRNGIPTDLPGCVGIFGVKKKLNTTLRNS